VAQVWLGLLDAEPLPNEPEGYYGEFAGAFIWFGCLAEDFRQFTAIATAHMARSGWKVNSAGLLQAVERGSLSSIDDAEMRALIDAVSRDGRPRPAETWDLYRTDEE